MSSFQVRVVDVEAVEPHPDADAIEIARIGGYRSVVRKADGLRAGDSVVYIPQSSVVPGYLLRRLGLWDEEQAKGRLGGQDGDRVSAARLRGVLSQGICLGLVRDGDELRLAGESGAISVRPGDDVAEFLGIRKWVPVIPPELTGDVFDAGREVLVDFDIEDVKAYPDAMIPGEEVEYTEKLHGVFTAVTVVPGEYARDNGIDGRGFGPGGNVLVYSKGLGAQGLAFLNTPKNAGSVYLRATARLVGAIGEVAAGLDVPFTVMGETFGPGVQDLHYGKELGFRMFGACSGFRGGLTHFGPERRSELARALGIEQVPCLYRGPFSWETLAEHTDGKTLLGGGHIREGVVVTPVVQREHVRMGRVIAKSVSERYLLRKGGTEYS